MGARDISSWFEAGVFKRIFSASRLSKFHNRVTSTLKFVNFKTWSKHASDISKMALIEIMEYRDVDLNLAVTASRKCQFCENNCYKKYRQGSINMYSYDFCLTCKRYSSWVLVIYDRFCHFMLYYLMILSVYVHYYLNILKYVRIALIWFIWSIIFLQYFAENKIFKFWFCELQHDPWTFLNFRTFLCKWNSMIVLWVCFLWLWVRHYWFKIIFQIILSIYELKYQKQVIKLSTNPGNWTWKHK